MHNLILVTEAAEIAGVDRDTIRRWVSSGLVAGRKTGSVFVVDKDSLVRFHKARSEKSHRPAKVRTGPGPGSK